MTTPEALEALGLVAPGDPAPHTVVRLTTTCNHSRSGSERCWPDYELYIKGAPVAKEGGPDRSAHSDCRNASSARLSVGVSLEKRSVTSSASFW